jgi:hypothetical protein
MPTLSGKWRWVLLLVLTAVVTLLLAWVAVRGKQLGPAASAVLQAGSVVLSVYGGVVFTREGNDKHVRSAAQASARRLLVNYEMLGRLATIINDSSDDLLKRANSDAISSDLVEVVLRGLEQQVLTQISSADAAIQDWRDLAPEEVDREVRRVREGRS